MPDFTPTWDIPLTRENATPARIAPAATIANGSLFANANVSTGDRLRLYVANITSASDVKVLDVTFAARG